MALQLDLDTLVAIDVHTHVHADTHGHKALDDELNEAASKYFKGDPYFANLDNALTMFIMPKAFYSRLQPSEINTGTGLLMGSGPYKLERLDTSCAAFKTDARCKVV